MMSHNRQLLSLRSKMTQHGWLLDSFGTVLSDEGGTSLANTLPCLPFVRPSHQQHLRVQSQGIFAMHEFRCLMVLRDSLEIWDSLKHTPLIAQRMVYPHVPKKLIV